MRCSSACSTPVALSVSTDPSVIARRRRGRGGDRHPGRRAPQPRPARGRRDARARTSSTSATASCSCCAAPSTPGSPRASSGCSRATASTVDVAFCPERIAEGKAMERAVHACPRSSSGRTQEVRDRAAALFRNLTDSIVELEPEEAELAKLFTNTWRYIKFAAANQFYVMANDHGLDFDRIRTALAPRLPACGGHARRGLRGRAVPVQGHDAAGRVHATTPSSSATPRCWSTRGCRSTS